MDTRLVAWARAVKARRANAGLACVPPLWLFTDAARLPDPLSAARALPRGLAGVVLRDDALAGRAALARALARICRERRLAFSVAGDWRLAAAVGAGVHARGGQRLPRMPRWLPIATSSAHDAVQLRRGRLAGAAVFLSPAFATASHPGAPALGPVRWARLAGAGKVLALGGIDGRTVRSLPGARCCGAGAIGALA